MFAGPRLQGDMQPKKLLLGTGVHLALGLSLKAASTGGPVGRGSRVAVGRVSGGGGGW